MEDLKVYKKIGSGLKIMFIAFLLRMVIAVLNIDDLGKMINFFLEPVEKILILSGFLVAGSVVHKYRWGAFFTFLEFFVEFLSGFMMGLTRNVILATVIINSSAVMTFARICVLCLITGAILREEEENEIFKHGMLLIGIYGISAGNVILTVLSYYFPIFEKVVSILTPLYILTLAGVVLYGIYLGRGYLFFERFVEDKESSLNKSDETEDTL